MIEANGTVYAAFVDNLHYNKAVVMRKAPAGWTSLSPTTIPDSNATSIKLAVIKDVLYLGYYSIVKSG